MHKTSETTTTLKSLYRHMVTAREIDLIEQDYTQRGEAFFHVSGAGHEGSAMLIPHLRPEDWLHCHYRDKALMLARGLSPRMFFLSLFNKDESHSRGRQMNAHMSAPDLNILSLVGPVGNSALQAAGVAEVVRDQHGKPIVLCSLGDGMTQQGEVLEAIAHAVRDNLPVLFLVQDNAFAISTHTGGRTFYSRPSGKADEFYGIPIRYLDGRFPEACFDTFAEVVSEMRQDRAPAIVVFEVDRLSNHTNADDQRVYRTAEEIEAVGKTGDPIIHLNKALVDQGEDPAELEAVVTEIRTELKATAEEVQRSAEPKPVFDAIRPLPAELKDSKAEYRGGSSKSLTMLEAIREVLKERLGADERVALFGEDIEDPKGDVFGITKGLSDTYPGRIVNSPLAESTIVGVSVGMALAGRRPVAFLQFADFLPIAFNQIWSELGSMFWRTDGGWQAPVIVMITCGGYRPGLGPFHASTLEAIAAHTPGVDVFMPSTAGDAAGLLQAAFRSQRPTLFFYPKNCLNDRENATSSDVSRQLVPIGRARTVQAGNHITMVGWGNTVPLCVKAAKTLEAEGVEPEIIDLRSLVPWDIDAVVASAEKTGRILVAHEDTHTAGFGAEVVATVSERARVPVRSRRVTRGDTYVPCNFGNQLEVLPSYKRILETAVEMLDGNIAWRKDAAAGERTVDAIGSSPSDESITVIEWHIKPGQEVKTGDPVATLEADKAAIELNASESGVIAELLVPEGDVVKVGTPIARFEADDQHAARIKPITREEPGEPIISDLRLEKAVTAEKSIGRSSAGTKVSIVGVRSVLGSRRVSNQEISEMCPDWTPEDIVKRTGIESRPWAAEGETVVTLGSKAAGDLLTSLKVKPDQIDLVVCTTETPIAHTPSMANMIYHRLAGDAAGRPAAYDINAACTGYIYALQVAYDYLQSRPNHRVLLVTSEVLSPQVDTSDPQTAPIFGDAATATLIVGDGVSEGRGPAGRPSLSLGRPIIGAASEDGTILSVPNDGKIFMDGPKVFVEAVRDMMDAMEAVCTEAGLATEDLGLIVPHQANQRIINAIRQRLKFPASKMYSNIASHGNTSSSTIPLCLEEILDAGKLPETIGITAFGGGFTYGAAILYGA